MRVHRASRHWSHHAPTWTEASFSYTEKGKAWDPVGMAGPGSLWVWRARGPRGCGTVTSPGSPWVWQAQGPCVCGQSVVWINSRLCCLY